MADIHGKLKDWKNALDPDPGVLVKQDKNQVNEL